MFLSASRIKTYLTCSWTYYLTYELGFRGMDEGNDGSRRGTICHLVLECLQAPRRHHLIAKFLESGFAGNPNIYRLVLKNAKIVGVDDQTNMDLMEGFIKVGLKSDFLCEGWDLKEPEKKFQIESENPEYKILGFIDKHAMSECGLNVRIDDYKTSKAKFTGKDAKFNVQSLIYALAMIKEGNYSRAFVNFVFLKFPKNPWQRFEYDQKILRGFEHYLAEIYKFLKNFNVKKAHSNFARDNENYFLCGKELGQFKVNGDPAWVCPWKRPFLYWEIRNAEGKLKTTAKLEKDALDKMGEGDTIVQKYYGGCPKWNKFK